MGRGKIDIKKIENSTQRQVTFSKRKNGLIKKATEISQLCEAKVMLVIFSSGNKMYDWCSTSMTDVLDLYHKLSGERLWDPKQQLLKDELDNVKKEQEQLEVQLRHLSGDDLNSLTIQDLRELAELLQVGKVNVGKKGFECFDGEMQQYRQSAIILEEENRKLKDSLHQHELTLSALDEHERRGGYAAQSGLPFVICMQSTRANLHHRN